MPQQLSKSELRVEGRWRHHRKSEMPKVTWLRVLNRAGSMPAAAQRAMASWTMGWISSGVRGATFPPPGLGTPATSWALVCTWRRPPPGPWAYSSAASSSAEPLPFFPAQIGCRAGEGFGLAARAHRPAFSFPGNTRCLWARPLSCHPSGRTGEPPPCPPYLPNATGGGSPAPKGRSGLGLLFPRNRRPGPAVAYCTWRRRASGSLKTPSLSSAWASSV